MINNEFIEINDISKIKDKILNYNVVDKKIYIDTKNKKYIISYELENEKKIVEYLENYFNILKNEINDKNKEYKLFKKTLVVIVCYSLLISLLAIVLPIFIPIILNLSSLIFGIKIVGIIKQLKTELEQLNYEKEKFGITLNFKKMDLKNKLKINNYRLNSLTTDVKRFEIGKECNLESNEPAKTKTLRKFN